MGKRDVPFAITHPERIPKERYYDETFFKLENEHFWPRVWQMACRLEEIPEIGDWTEYRILDRSVIIVRAVEDVKAYHNACTHRGMKLAEGCGNAKGSGFICPFHGWRFDIDGQNTYVHGRQLFSDEMLDPGELNLAPIRVELWGGCAFINFDDHAASLMDYIGPIARRLDPHNVADLKIEWRLEAVVPANWKLAMEAFMEGLHVMRTHPELHEVMLPGMDPYVSPTASASPTKMDSRQAIERLVEMNSVLSQGMSGMVHANDVAIMQDLKDTLELPDDPGEAIGHFFTNVNAEITRRGRERGVPVPDLNELSAHPDPLRRFVFPNYFLLTQFGNMTMYRIRPLTPESCLFEEASLILYPKDDQPPRLMPAERVELDDPRLPPITQQDFCNIPRQQEGLHAPGFKFMRLSSSIEGLISNYQRLIDGFLGGVEEKKLAAASQIASAGLDWPIEDIGFGPAPVQTAEVEHFSTKPKFK
ncbi:MAG: aromatic ring-hydroxylating dioxygenase subunit alpha [Novosphingobium sp.]|nr:aromatic ring-hydroxylating dioxygenase subunit alpha [Novosphingobium sp.]